MNVEGETDFERTLIQIFQNENSLLEELGFLLMRFGSICMYSSSTLLYLKIDKKWLRVFSSEDFGNSFYCTTISRLTRISRKDLNTFSFEIALTRARFAMEQDIKNLNGYGIPFFSDLNLPRNTGYRMPS